MAFLRCKLTPGHASKWGIHEEEMYAIICAIKNIRRMGRTTTFYGHPIPQQFGKMGHGTVRYAEWSNWKTSLLAPIIGAL